MSTMPPISSFGSAPVMTLSSPAARTPSIQSRKSRLAISRPRPLPCVALDGAMRFAYCAYGLLAKSMMKRALIGILAVTVAVGTANAQSYRRYSPARPNASQAYTPQGSGSVRQGVPRTTPFSDPYSAEATSGGNPGYNLKNPLLTKYPCGTHERDANPAVVLRRIVGGECLSENFSAPSSSAF